MQTLMTVIATWLSAGYGLPPLDEHPRIELVAVERIAEARHVRSGSARPDRATGDPSSPRSAEPDVHAFYDDLERTIYLPEDWTATSPTHVSMLVHELVHHLQNVAGERHACPEAREAPAYEAQSDWLEFLDTNLEEAFGIDAMTLLLRTRCLY